MQWISLTSTNDNMPMYSWWNFQTQNQVTNWKAWTTLSIVVDVHMVLYVIVRSFLMTLFMNKFTSIAIPNLLFVHLLPQNPTSFVGILICGYVPALARPLLCIIMHEGHTNCLNILWSIMHHDILWNEILSWTSKFWIWYCILSVSFWQYCISIIPKKSHPTRNEKWC